MSTYSTHAAICARFYDLIINAQKVGNFVYDHSLSKPGDKCLFVGGFFDVAKELFRKSLDLIVVDYTDDMVAVGRSKLPGVPVEKADLRSLPYCEQFDCIFVIGRVLTHMISETDLAAALAGCRRSLKEGGRFFFDNYEDTKIERTNYFNGTVKCGDSETRIERISSTERLSEIPYVVNWSARYTGQFQGADFSFSDSIPHRAFSRSEISLVLPKFGFKMIEQGDNFDDTSFFTLAQTV